MSNIGRGGTGRRILDKDRVGGLRFVLTANFDEDNPRTGAFGTPTYASTSSDEIMTLFTGTEKGAGTEIDLFMYNVRDNESMGSWKTLAPREQGTTMVEQTLDLNFPVLSKEDQDDTYQFAQGRPQFIAIDYNMNQLVFGLENGMDLDAADGGTGADLNTKSGQKYSFKGKERKLPNFLNATAIWIAGKIGSTVAADIKVGYSINGTAGTASS